MNRFDPRILGGIGVHNGAAVVGTAIIHRDDFYGAQSLVYNAEQGLLKIWFHSVGGHDHTDFGSHNISPGYLLSGAKARRLALAARS